ncbi:MAG TPA: hypothetical protein PKG54_17665 [Phycisphaerae bacterium]|nr:hypothetical protein [Phycisphaerae bacterium]HOB76342.1 hypothetical protein [Phycisphaerae bacterium]HOJ55410.1 hypothetical protein [Phycisphaerae bacterium]HOL24958.1 hypothetical protein [Phycisphaerae bacterium]HPP20060.1 hypothetical protein [Phycisphaerae bacterium]
MDSTTLERLLMDRALGQLSPDTEALLAAWLAEHPAARTLGEEIELTVAAARNTLTAGPAIPVPSFPAAEIVRRAGRSWSMWRMAGKAASLAACVLLGIGLHALWNSEASPHAPHIEPLQLVENSAPAPLPPVAAPSPESGFWSANRLREQVRQRRPERGTRVIWDSPLSMPRLGDAT